MSTSKPAFQSAEELDRSLRDWTQSLGISDVAAPQFCAPALLVLDMQNEFLDREGQLPVWGGPAILPQVSALVQAFRQRTRPVIFTRHVCIEPFAHLDTIATMRALRDPASFLPANGWSSDIHRDLGPAPGDHVITKYRYSAFFDSPLETLLRVAGIREVIVTGVATNICCEATAHDAFFRGFDVVFLIDATGGVDERSHLATLRTIQMAYGRLATTHQVQEALDRFPGGATDPDIEDRQ